MTIVPHDLPTNHAWIKPNRKNSEPWVEGTIIGCWAYNDSDHGISVHVLVKYGGGKMFSARLETWGPIDVIRLGMVLPPETGPSKTGNSQVEFREPACDAANPQKSKSSAS